MRFRTIPRTDIKVSEIGFGCWTMGGPNFNPQTGQPIGWADVREDELLAGVKAGLDHGVNHWDNADVYGNGVAERRLAAAFAALGVKRSTQVIATKVGHFRGTAPHGYEPRHLRNQCEQSLRNLRTEVIDLYYLHHGTFVGPGNDGREHDYLHEAADIMHALVREGKVRAIGQSAYSDDDFARAIPVVRPHVLQAKANLRSDEFIRPGSTLQRLMREHACAFVAFGPLDQGVLLDKFDPDKPPAFGEGDYRQNRKDFNPATLRAVREALAKVRATRGPDAPDATRFLASIAQRWILAHENILGVIPGFRNQRQALCNVAAGDDPAMGESDVAWLRGLFHRP